MSHRQHDASTISVGGTSFASMLTIAFIVLKLVGTITWSWWWVLSPIWISAGLAVVFGVIFFLLVLIFSDGGRV